MLVFELELPSAPIEMAVGGKLVVVLDLSEAVEKNVEDVPVEELEIPPG